MSRRRVSFPQKLCLRDAARATGVTKDFRKALANRNATIDSLFRQGYLHPDSDGLYRLTQAGYEALPAHWQSEVDEIRRKAQ